jgi:hypothetical protein
MSGAPSRPPGSTLQLEVKNADGSTRLVTITLKDILSGCSRLLDAFVESQPLRKRPRKGWGTRVVF